MGENPSPKQLDDFSQKLGEKIKREKVNLEFDLLPHHPLSPTERLAKSKRLEELKKEEDLLKEITDDDKKQFFEQVKANGQLSGKGGEISTIFSQDELLDVLHKSDPDLVEFQKIAKATPEVKLY